MSSKEQEANELEAKIRHFEALRDELGDAFVDSKQAELKERLQALGIEIDQRGQTIHGPQTNIAGSKVEAPLLSGRFSGPVDFSKHYHGTEAPIDAEQAEAIYRRNIAGRCGVLPLQSMEASPAGGESEPLSLAQVYIGLDTRQSALTTVIDKALKKAVQGSFDGLPSLKSAGGEAEIERKTRPVSALEAAILNRRLVLTGEPGSGKSTFVNHLTHALALERWDCLPGWPEQERNVLPIPVTLREFAGWLAEKEKPAKASASLLWDYVAHDLHQWCLGSAAGVLKKALGEGRAVVLLDGLDEVPADDEALLNLVKVSVQKFVERYEKNRHLLTCRVLSYQEPHWKLPAPAFPDVELARFDEDKIDRFIAAWYAEVGRKWQLNPTKSKRLAESLGRAVRRPDLWRLAPNPLLLTVMALVHSRNRELPEKRALLYEEAVDILLQKREQDKTVNAPQIRELLDQAGRDFNDFKAVLEELAFDTHGSGTVREAEDAAPIDTLTLQERVAALHPKYPKEGYDWARQLLAVLGLRASLLLERKDGVFSFPHRTFQEYLAGVYLARLDGDEFAKRAAKLAGDLPTYWREVVLLAVGYLVHKNRDTSKPRLLADELCPEESPDSEEGWRRVWLAGDVLREVGSHRIGEMKSGKRLLQTVTERLTELLERGALTARERAEAGDVLGELGDPRFDPDFFYLPCRYRGEPEPLAGFVEVPPGPFVMGEDRERQDLRIGYPYWIARYPVTVGQFRVFIDAGGYDTQDWWTKTGWAWRQGRGEPRWWSAQRIASNRPVMGVSWFEALAYCRWLDDSLRRSGKVSLLENKGYIVRLPTEAEWEKAARGGGSRRYPWGDEDWDEERANSSDSEIGHATAVGMYPKGVTAANSAALHDLGGNVWEWTLSLYRDYPYRPEDGRNDLNAEGRRVVRGGSWDFDRWLARCAFRSWDLPDGFYTDLGFRVVLSLADSEF